MFHRKYEKLAVLSAYGELSRDETEIFSKHLLTCEKCKKTHERACRMAGQGPANQAQVRLEGQLTFIRGSLYNNIHASAGALRGNRIYGIARIPGFAVAAVAAMSFLIGGASSYLYFDYSNHESSNRLTAIANVISREPSDVSIGDVRFISNDPHTGQLDFSFSLMKHYQFKGSLADRDVQKVLAFALVNSSNPGTRIKTVDMLNTVAEKPASDVEIALIKAAEADDNPGVRRAALLSLEKMPFDTQIKNALLSILQGDPNPGMRVSAINILSSKELSGNIQGGKNEIDPRVQQVLKQKMESDQNLYVRTKAADILKEYKEM